jgi:hypothetical protein
VTNTAAGYQQEQEDGQQARREAEAEKAPAELPDAADTRRLVKYRPEEADRPSQPAASERGTHRSG